jgi:ABC-2 type transport system permease protein
VNNIIRIAVFEIQQMVRRGSFWFVFFAVPALALCFSAVVLGHSQHFGHGNRGTPEVGIVDESLLIEPAQAQLYARQLQIFSNRAKAFDALKKGQIESFYLIPNTYLSGGQIICYLRTEQPFKRVPSEIDSSAASLLRLALSGGNVLTDRIPLYRSPLRPRLIYVHNSSQKDGGEESERIGRIATPVLLLIMFFSVVLFSSGYLLNSINIERQNKILESLCARVSPGSLIVGKWLSVVLVSISQQVIYAGLVLWKTPALGIVPIRADRLIIVVIELLLGYSLISLSTLVVGLVSRAGQDGTQFGIVILMALSAPILIVFASQWDNGLPWILSVLPFTSPVAMLLRLCLSDVPSADVVLSLSTTSIAIVAVMLIGRRAVKSALGSYADPIFARSWRSYLRVKATIGTLH